MPPKGRGGKAGGKGRGYGGEAFSGAKKKQLLQSKRAKKRQTDDSDSASGEERDRHDHELGSNAPSESTAGPVLVTSFGGRGDADEYRLSSLFAREDDDVVAARKQRGAEPLVNQGDARLAPTAEEFAPFKPKDVAVDGESRQPALGRPQNQFLPHPVRPSWPEGISADKLDRQERAYFKEWCEDTFAKIKAFPSASDGVAPFELNLEVWRQLWRVVERSDVVVLIADVRNPTFHIPPSLVHEVTVKHGKRLVVALSKCDLVSQAFAQRWKRYLADALPGVEVVDFMSRPAEEAPGGERGAGGVSARRKWITRRIRQGEQDAHLRVMAKALLRGVLGQPAEEAPKAGKQSAYTMAPASDDEELEEEEEEESQSEESDAESEPRPPPAVADGARVQTSETGAAEDARSCADGNPLRFQGLGPGGALAIGLVGHPNVGKTSVLNALAGRKAASVSGTAGHTKHLQHIRVDESVHPFAYVLDCPGLVFPSLHTRAHAELHGLLPLAQVRETMSALRILAEALPLPKMYALKLPDWYDDGDPWTPLALCEAYAEKRKYSLPRTGAPDVHRAGLEIAKDGNNGALLLAYEPPALSDAHTVRTSNSTD